MISTAYGAQTQGEDGATKILRNLVVPPTFVSIKGKDFGEVVASKMVNYGKEWQGINFADGQDPYYNPEKAKAKFVEAKKELEAKEFNSLFIWMRQLTKLLRRGFKK